MLFYNNNNKKLCFLVKQYCTDNLAKNIFEIRP
jgi:hypothetical protein